MGLFSKREMNFESFAKAHVRRAMFTSSAALMSLILGISLGCATHTADSDQGSVAESGDHRFETVGNENLPLTADQVMARNQSSDPSRSIASTTDDPSAIQKRSIASANEQCSSYGWSEVVTPQHQEIINQLMGSREHRAHHALWHAVRGGVDAQTSNMVAQGFGPTWIKDHPLCPAPLQDATARDYNAAGEDFLFMHRQMVQMLRAAFVQAGLPCVTGWRAIPNESEYPLPDNDRTDAKSPAVFNRMLGWEGAFHSQSWLKSKSLSQVGFALEFSLHNNLHMRYATTKPPRGYAELTSIGGAPMPMDNAYPATWKYDSPSYNWLADPYGAALNPTFWKIHGYVDDVIDLWLQANGYQTAAVDCRGIKACYQWRGQWTGDPAGHNHAGHNVFAGTRKPASAGDTGLDNETAQFTRARMARQHLGVVHDPGPMRNPPTGPVVAAGLPEDPYQYAKDKLCR